MKLVKILCFAAILCCVACKSQKDEKIERMIDLYASIATDISLKGDFNVFELKELQSEIAGIPEFNRLDSLLSAMLEKGSPNILKHDSDCPVDIQVRASGPSVVNGWDARVKVKNNSNKVLKYVYFTVVGENSVGDKVSCKYNTKCRWQGPLKPGKTSNNGLCWTLYLENQMKRNSFKAEDIKIDFMDGTSWPEVPDNKKVVSMFHSVFMECKHAYEK